MIKWSQVQFVVKIQVNAPSFLPNKSKGRMSLLRMKDFLEHSVGANITDVAGGNATQRAIF
jgi:predicted amino acid racemase